MNAPGATDLISAAIGIPHGLVVDPVDGQTRGVVRRGGELVTIEPPDYQAWNALGIPRSSQGLNEAAVLVEWPDIEDRIRRLRADNLLVDFRLSGTLTDETKSLRPIPRGLGSGNVGGDLDVFRIDGYGAGSKPLEVDPVTVLLWWEFDGLASLQDAVDRVASRLPDMSSDDLGPLALALTFALLAQRLIYLDCPASDAS